jgi:hypothetical protein
MPLRRSKGAVVPLCALLSFACGGELVLTEPMGGGGGGDGDDTAAREMFTAEIDPLFAATRPKGACMTCHQGADAVNGPDFLGTGPTTHYDTITTFLIIGATPEASILYNKPDHTGNTWCTGTDLPYAGCTQDEKAILADWIDVLNGS